MEIPTNYSAEIKGKKMFGKILNQNASFQLFFVGVNSNKLGFIELEGSEISESKKRKYNLVTNNSLERQTIEDQKRAFKKLTYNSVFWYDRNRKGELEPRTQEEIEKRGIRKSCPICKEPIFEQISKSGEKIEVCKK